MTVAAWIGLDIAAGILLLTLVLHGLLKITNEFWDFIFFMIAAIMITAITLLLFKVCTTEDGLILTPKSIFAGLLASILGYNLLYTYKQNYTINKKNK